MADIRTKSEFYNAALAELESGDFPALKARMRAGDVTITQQIGAMAQMFSMLSYQIGLAETEVWQKTRDNMVLADASMKGILPFATAAKYRATVYGDVRIAAGRRLLDKKGRIWRVIDGGTANSDGLGITIEQVDSQSTLHTVSERRDFYQITIPEPKGAYLAMVDVFVNDVFFPRSYRFNNIDIDEAVYQLMVDEMLQMQVCFGVSGIAGAVLSAGDRVRIQAGYTQGDVELSGELSFEYINDNEVDVVIRAGERLAAGKPPRSLDELRMLAQYPFLYNDNAVFLGEFEFLIHKNMRGFEFLSVWNEVAEEQARGANADNINTLFVSFVNPHYQKAEAEAEIRRIIAASDDSYKVKFVAAREEKIRATVNLRLPVIYDEAPIKAQVKTLMLQKYGKGTEFSRKGGRINWQQTVAYLKDNIYELSDGLSDVSVTVVEPSNRLPEIFSFLDTTTLTVNNTPIL